jgi:hypothetical protein
MCEAQEMWYELSPIDGDLVAVRVKIERKLRNITNRPQELTASLDIDEWGFSQKSAVSRCELHDINHSIIQRTDAGQLDDEYVIHAKSGNICSVSPGEEMIVVSDFIEIRRNNDHMVSVFKSPTKNPKIHISAAGLGYQLDFGVLSQKRNKSAVSETHTLEGVYFPPANFRLRWYPRLNGAASK